jgi:hypothetical protein
MTGSGDTDLLVLDSVTRMDESHRGKVLVAGSHGGVYAAYLAALGRLRGVILNDAGVGKEASPPRPSVTCRPALAPART